MKRYIIPVLLLLQGISLLAQKPPIDTSLYGKWARVGMGNISPDGAYMAYVICNQPVGRKLIIQGLHSSWKKELENVDDGKFTRDSHHCIVKLKGDSLALVTLGSTEMQYQPNVQSFELVQGAAWEYLVCQPAHPDNMLEVRSTVNLHMVQSFDGVRDHQLSKDGKVLLIKRSAANGGAGTSDTAGHPASGETVDWIDLPACQRKTIYVGPATDDFVFNRDNTGLCFRVAESGEGDQASHSLWYYHSGMERADRITTDGATGLADYLQIDRPVGFTDDGEGIFFNLHRKASPVTPPSGAIMVDVWSYKDSVLQSQQLKEADPQNFNTVYRQFTSILHLRDRRIVELSNEFELVTSPIGSDDAVCKGHYVVVEHSDRTNEWYWNPAAKESACLVSTEDGKRIPIGPKSSKEIPRSWLSPQGRYLVYYDADQKNYYSYCIASGLTRNITKGIKTIWTTLVASFDSWPSAKFYPVGVTGFMADDEDVFIYDRSDIYRVSLSGAYPPMNLTNGYGGKHNIELRLASNRDDEIFTHHQRILLNANDRNTKDNGFYSITLGQQGDPTLLSMQHYKLESTREDDRFRMHPLFKAQNAELYIVFRQDASESPNLFWTIDFKIYHRITDVHPEKEYNWMTSELMTWTTFTGSRCQGVLYKPEDFDPKKKYPVIFYYYERSSEGLHGFIEPDFSIGTLNIPWYVSHGYLVCTPDIHYQTGHPGRSVVNCVVSAARYLSRNPWVDSTRMGIQGHSRGGWETDYLITHSHVFAAAMSASGFTDYVGLYNGIYAMGGGESKQYRFELGPQRIGATLWQRPDLYIENSPVFKADKVTTPVLILADKLDNQVPFEQGIEFFTALRRLGKKAWMLQYDNEKHVVEGAAAIDYTIRMQQFFDHYLKGAPAPRWMTEGIPATRKGIDNGLELDTSGREP